MGHPAYTPTKLPSCRPRALTRRPDLVHNENCWPEQDVQEAMPEGSARAVRRFDRTVCHCAYAQCEATAPATPRPP
jgi:hypothetical protein